MMHVMKCMCPGPPLVHTPSPLSSNPLILLLHHMQVTTVDKFQGQQNDYVLLSLVRTNHFGHLRDIRRLGELADRVVVFVVLLGCAFADQGCAMGSVCSHYIYAHLLPAVVAMSRARLGLYVFGRANLFSNCFELQPTFSQLLARPVQLALVPGEHYGHCTRKQDDVPLTQLVSSVEQMAGIVQFMCQQWEAAAAAWARSSVPQGGNDVAAAAAGAVEQAVHATAPPAAEGQEEADGDEGGEEQEGDGSGEEGGEEEGSEDSGSDAEEDQQEAPIQQD
jgi:intron-binding protein aquarius